MDDLKSDAEVKVLVPVEPVGDQDHPTRVNETSTFRNRVGSREGGGLPVSWVVWVGTVHVP